MKYIAYRRVSHEEQAESGLGLEAQSAAIEKHLGHAPDMDFTDEGISGSRADRPGLLAALESLKRGDVLIVAKRDRLARDVFLSCWIEKECKKRGASIASVAGEGTDSDEPAAVLMRRMVDAFSEYERLIIGQRTSAAMQRKRARGETTGNAPYGYRVSTDGIHLEANPDEQAVIQIIIELRQAGYSTRAIASEMNAQGYRTRRGTEWKFQYVASIIKAAA